MLDKFKEAVSKAGAASSETIDKETIAVSENADGSVSARMKGYGETLAAKSAHYAEKVKDVNVFDKVKSFTTASVKTVEEIDAHLVHNRSIYEINNFRVSSTAGVTAGMTLDIHFVKNARAKELATELSKFMTVTNPKTGSKIKVPLAALDGKEQAKIKDPKSGEVLTIDAKTGEILEG